MSANPNGRIRGEDMPGGQDDVGTSWAPLSSDTTACKSITIIADSGTIYWGYDDVLTGGDTKIRGFITASGAVEIPAPITPHSIYLRATAASSVYWSGIPA